MSTAYRLIIDCITPLEGLSPTLVGGKAYNLFRLRDAGFPVPDWYVLSSKAFDEVMDSSRPVINAILAGVDMQNQQAVVDASERISGLIRESYQQSRLKARLRAVLEKLLCNPRGYAVRSSVVGEDSSEHSFAGLMDSYLNVRGADSEDAIVKVWCSAFSPRVLAYRSRKSIPSNNITTAVVIQNMVGAEQAGVLFTRNPESAEHESVVAAAWGLGEGVVGNLVESDTYRVRCESWTVCRQVAHKKRRVACSQSAAAGTALEDVPQQLQLRPVLSSSQIRQLCTLGMSVEQAFGVPQDIEWAFDAEGRVTLLQSRPIMPAGWSSTAKTRRVWESSNIVESYPGVTLPLTFSFVRMAYAETFRKAVRGFLPVKRILDRDAGIFSDLVGLLNGRVYYNLFNWYRMLSYLPGYARFRASWNRMLGIGHDLESPQPGLPRHYRLLSGIMVLWRLLRTRGNARGFFRAFEKIYASLRATSIETLTEDETASAFGLLRRETGRVWHRTVYNDFAAMTYFAWLANLCDRWVSRDEPQLHNNLLCGQKGIESAAAVRSLARIAQMVCADPKLRRVFDVAPEDELWTLIQTQVEFTPVKIALVTHVERYGDRGIEELKLETLTFRENPAQVVGLLKDYVRLELSPQAMDRQEQEIRSRAEERMRAALGWGPRRLLFGMVLSRARRAIAARENMRFARSRTFGMVRRLFRRLGMLLEAQGLIHCSADINYLTVDEVLGFIGGTSVFRDLKAAVALRKKEYAEIRDSDPPERIETTGIPSVSSRALRSGEGNTSGVLRGIGCTAGSARGKARLVLDPRTHTTSPDTILIARSTDPGWVFLMISSKGIVVEHGSVLSHTATVGRELGIPTVVGVKGATSLIREGSDLSIDGRTGVVQWN